MRRPIARRSNLHDTGMQVAVLEADLVEGGEAEKKPSFPADPREQTGAVFAALLTADSAADAKSLAKQFRGRGVEAKITATLAALSRLGQTVSADGGKTVRLRHKLLP